MCTDGEKMALIRLRDFSKREHTMPLRSLPVALRFTSKEKELRVTHLPEDLQCKVGELYTKENSILL